MVLLDTERSGRSCLISYHGIRGLSLKSVLMQGPAPGCNRALSAPGKIAVKLTGFHNDEFPETPIANATAQSNEAQAWSQYRTITTLRGDCHLERVNGPINPHVDLEKVRTLRRK